MSNIKTALVLSGGGSRGAYEIGVWQALSEMGENISLVTGTSVGALNGAVVAQGSLEQARQLWLQLETSRVFDVTLDETLPQLQKRIHAFGAFSRAAVGQGGAGTEALAKILHQYINESAVYSSPVEFGMVTCQLDTMRPIYIWKEQMGEGRLHDYLLASSSLFPAIRPHVIDGIRYVDGGFADNMPVRMALEKGANRIFAVDMRAVGRTHPLPRKAGVKTIFIRPYWDLGALLLFDPAFARHNMRLGYLDTLRACEVYDGAAYAFIKGSFNRLARRYTGFYEIFGKVCGLKDSGGFLEAAASAPLQKRVSQRLRTRSCTIAGLALDGAESAGELLGLDPGLLYSLDRFDERLAEAVAQTSDSHRVLILARHTADVLAGKKSPPLIPAAALQPAEFSAALYLVSAGVIS